MTKHRHSSSYSNTELVERCLQGDAAAWQELVDRYGRLVHSVPVRYGLTPMEVDDVGQEVFLALAQSLHQLEDPERLSGWLVTTARRTSWRLLQKRRREQITDSGDLLDASVPPHVDSAAADDESGYVFASGPPSMQDLIEGWTYQEALQAGLEKMGERCRQLLTLLFLAPEEPSYDEIGEQLEMPIGSIGPTRTRCLQKLRQILEGLGYDDFF